MYPLRPLQLRNLAFLTLVLGLLAGCPSNPIREATTPEQRAYAIAGEYEIGQARVLDLLAQPQTPIILKDALKRADAAASPVVVQMIAATKLYSTIKAELAGTQGDARLAAAAANLEDWTLKAKPLVKDLIDTLEHRK